MPRKNHRPAIVEIINHSGLPVGNSNITEVLEVHPQVVTHCLRHLTYQKKIRRIGSGRFTRYIAMGPKGDAAWAAYIEPQVQTRIQKAKKPLTLANLCESIDATNRVVHLAVENLRKRGAIVRLGTDPNHRYTTPEAEQADKKKRKRKTGGEPQETIEYRRYTFSTGEKGWEWILRDRGTVVAQCAHLDKTAAIQAAEDYLRKRQEILKPIRQGGKDYGDYRR